MALENNFNIEKFLDLTGYDTEERVSRRKNSKVNSQEFFTPYEIVKKIFLQKPNFLENLSICKSMFRIVF